MELRLLPAPADGPASHCCFCSMQCGIELVQEENGIAIRPSQRFPVATGRLCQKGLNAHQHVLHPSRVLKPLARQAPKGCAPAWREAGWDEALDAIAGRIRDIQARYGRDAVGVYGGGSLTNEVCYLLGKFARVALGTRYIDYNGRYCMSSAAAAAVRAFGADRGLTMPLSEIPNARYLILAGTNLAECQPTMMPYLLEAKKNGAVVVAIDPRKTPTAKSADVHVRIYPGMDAVFVSGLLHVIVEERLYDERFVRERTLGFEALAEAVRPYTPRRVFEITGIPEEVVVGIARGFAKAPTGIVLTARGVEQQVNGVDNTLHYINLCLVTGKIGRPGCGFGAITGQANGQGGREHGQKADQLPGYRSIEDPAARAHIARVWGVPEEDIPGKGVSAYEMLRKIDDGEIRALFVMGSNPVVSSPNSSVVERSLRKLDLLVVVDLFETETAREADWLLPANAFLETEGTLTNLEGRVFQRAQAVKRPPGVKADYEILCELAERLGKGAYFRYRTPEDIFNELREASRGGVADYGGITYERLRKEKGVFWPCPSEDHPGTPIMFADRFAHPDGKARIIPVEPKRPAETADADFPIVLTTGRLGAHYLSGAQTRRSEALVRKAPEPFVEIHPRLAERLGLKRDSRLRLTTRRGSAVFGYRITDAIHPGVVFVPFHWGDELSVNRLTNDALSPVSRMPEFKICAVRVEREDGSEAEDGRGRGEGGG